MLDFLTSCSIFNVMGKIRAKFEQNASKTRSKCDQNASTFLTIKTGRTPRLGMSHARRERGPPHSLHQVWLVGPCSLLKGLTARAAPNLAEVTNEEQQIIRSAIETKCDRNHADRLRVQYCTYVITNGGVTSRHQQASDTTKCSPERQKYSVTN